ncbi:cytochrome P450 [Phlegmacium glaucopus]|nr:cytochrome P450 [Phlegmacium glaucopus]
MFPVIGSLGLLVLCLAFGLAVNRAQRSSATQGPSLSWSESRKIWTAGFPYIWFTTWAKKYGDIYMFKARGERTIILTSARTVKGLLNKHGAITGGRPQVLLQNRVTDAFLAHLDSDSEFWKRGNRALHHFFTPEAADQQVPTQQTECVKLCSDLLVRPEDLTKHVLRTLASISLSLIFGKTCPTYENSLTESFHQFTSMQMEIWNVESSWPHLLLRYTPWMIAPWRGLCDKARKTYIDFLDPLISECETAHSNGQRSGCYMEYLLDNQAKFELNREELCGLALSLMEGYDTSGMFVMSFVFTLMTFPECQKRAQEEMDRIVGTGRLPELSDFQKLPYLSALVNEHHRFRPMIPYSGAHKATGSCVYDGIDVQQGDVIILNAWGINRDSDLYDEPELFNPERYLTSQLGTKLGANTTDLRLDWIFGSGRRKCPGYEPGQKFMIISAMLLIWSFSFERHPSDGPENGLAEDLNNYTSGPYLTPKEFQYKVIPRSKERSSLLKA